MKLFPCYRGTYQANSADKVTPITITFTNNSENKLRGTITPNYDSAKSDHFEGMMDGDIIRFATGQIERQYNIWIGTISKDCINGECTFYDETLFNRLAKLDTIQEGIWSCKAVSDIPVSKSGMKNTDESPPLSKRRSIIKRAAKKK